MPQTIGTPLLWVSFTLLILFLLSVDLGVFHRKAHEVSLREALFWSILWIIVALLFNGWIFIRFGSTKSLEFFTGYLIERALSIDNIFVFLVIFTYFSVPKLYHHRVLYWGILGALIMRALFIFTGTTLLHAFHWVLYLFGILLIFTGFRVLIQQKEEINPERNPILRLFRKFVPILTEFRGAKFLTRERGRLYATPLLLVLIVVETTDLVFALDSIPAIFAITFDSFIIYTSNIFAILGLRALYFLLAGVMDKFRYLKIGLGGVLIFVGLKMFLSDLFHISIGISLLIVSLFIGGSILCSLLFQPRVSPLPIHGEDPPKTFRR